MSKFSLPSTVFAQMSNLSSFDGWGLGRAIDAGRQLIQLPAGTLHIAGVDTSFVPGAQLTIAGAGKNETFITSDAINPFIVNNSSQLIEFRDLTIVGSGASSSNAITHQGTNGRVRLTNASIRGFDFNVRTVAGSASVDAYQTDFSAKEACVLCADGSGVVTISRSTFTNTGSTNQQHCLYMQRGISFDISYCDFISGPGYGIHCWLGAATPSYARVSNSTFRAEMSRHILGSAGVVTQLTNNTHYVRDFGIRPRAGGVTMSGGAIIGVNTGAFGVYDFVDQPATLTFTGVPFTGQFNHVIERADEVNPSTAWVFDTCAFGGVTAGTKYYQGAGAPYNTTFPGSTGYP